MVEQVNAYLAKGVSWVAVMDTDAEYLPGMGRNWKGPTGLFKLKIEKNDTHQFMSVCLPGTPQQIGSTTYEVVRRDFMPSDELAAHLYTVQPSPAPEDEQPTEDDQSLEVSE